MGLHAIRAGARELAEEVEHVRAHDAPLRLRLHRQVVDGLDRYLLGLRRAAAHDDEDRLHGLLVQELQPVGGRARGEAVEELRGLAVDVVVPLLHDVLHDLADDLLLLDEDDHLVRAAAVPEETDEGADHCRLGHVQEAHDHRRRQEALVLEDGESFVVGRECCQETNTEHDKLLPVRRVLRASDNPEHLENELFESLLDGQGPHLSWRREDCEHGFATVAKELHIVVLVYALH